MPQLMALLLLHLLTATACAAGLQFSAPDLEVSQPTDGLPPADPERRPYYDIVVAVLVRGGNSTDGLEEVALVRENYQRYDRRVYPKKESDNLSDRGDITVEAPLTIKYIFVVGRAGLPDGIIVPQSGLLLGDFYHVNTREGYRFIGDKTRAMLGIHEHLRFRFLGKTDGDTFPCWSYIARRLVDLPYSQQPRVYAGKTRRGARVLSKGQFADEEFAMAFQGSTLGRPGDTVISYPQYNMGALYILGERLVRHLHAGRNMLSLFPMEDAMVGAWLLGLDKVVLSMAGDFRCRCYDDPSAEIIAFSHHCKTREQLEACAATFGSC